MESLGPHRKHKKVEVLPWMTQGIKLTEQVWSHSWLGSLLINMESLLHLLSTHVTGVVRNPEDKPTLLLIRERLVGWIQTPQKGFYSLEVISRGPQNGPEGQRHS